MTTCCARFLRQKELLDVFCIFWWAFVSFISNFITRRMTSIWSTKYGLIDMCISCVWIFSLLLFFFVLAVVAVFYLTVDLNIDFFVYSDITNITSLLKVISFSLFFKLFSLSLFTSPFFQQYLYKYSSSTSYSAKHFNNYL